MCDATTAGGGPPSAVGAPSSQWPASTFVSSIVVAGSTPQTSKSPSANSAASCSVPAGVFALTPPTAYGYPGSRGVVVVCQVHDASSTWLKFATDVPRLATVTAAPTAHATWATS